MDEDENADEVGEPCDGAEQDDDLYDDGRICVIRLWC